MNYAALRTEIIAGPKAAALAADYAAGRDGAVADALNAPDQRGPVTITLLSGYCLALGVTGGVLAVVEIPIGGQITPPGVAMTLDIKTALHKYLTLVQIDFRLTTVDLDDAGFSAGCDGLIGLQLLTAGGKATLLGLGNNQRSRADIAVGRTVTYAEVESARKGNS